MNWYKLLLAECNSSLKCATTHPRLVEKIIELYTKKKLSTPQISTLIGLGVGTIRSILKRRGVLRTWEQATGNKIIPMTSAEGKYRNAGTDSGHPQRGGAGFG